MRLPRRAQAPALYKIAPAAQITRVYDNSFDGNAFNPCMGRPTRFTHLQKADGSCLPTLYAATTLDGAAYETVFRGPAHKYSTVTRQSLNARSIAVLEPVRALHCVPLFTPELRGWGIEERALFLAKSGTYPECRALAQMAHRDNPGADGLIWSSVQDSGAFAMLLFGDRVAKEDLRVLSERRVDADHTALEDLRKAGQRAGWVISK